MSKNTDTEEEQSIEEILDAIRHIINEEEEDASEDDQDAETEEDAEDTAEAEDDEDLGEEAPEPVDEIDFDVPNSDKEEKVRTSVSSGDEIEEDEVLELTERVPSEPADIEIDLADPPEPEPEEEIEDVKADDEPEADVTMNEKPEMNDHEEPSRDDSLSVDRSTLESDGEALLTSQAEVAAISAMKELVRKTAVEHNGITLEDIVRAELKPLLKDWLDQHLPSVIERLVQEELERVSRRVLED